MNYQKTKIEIIKELHRNKAIEVLIIKNNCNYILFFYSDNDPYVKYDAEKEFADAITKNHIIISGGGHLNPESGYTEFPELLKYL